MIDTLKTIWNNKRTIAEILITIVLIVLCAFLYFRYQASNSEAVQLQYELTTKSDALEKFLNIDKKSANEVADKIKDAQSGKTEPTAKYEVPALDLSSAASKTTKDINNYMSGNITPVNSYLPKQAVEKTDRTVVTANTDQQKVDVYKINLRNNHKLKGGVLYHDNGLSVGAGYQAGKWEGMVYAGHGKPDYAINYTLWEK